MRERSFEQSAVEVTVDMTDDARLRAGLVFRVAGLLGSNRGYRSLSWHFRGDR